MELKEINVINFGLEVFPIMQEALDNQGLGVRAFPVIAPTDSNGTIVVYARDGATEPQSFMGGRACTLQVNVVSEEYDEGVAVAEVIVRALLGQDKFICDMVDLVEAFKDNKYYQAIAFEINFY